MPTNSLSDSKCRAAKAGDKPVKLFDGHGLHLYVTPAGSKVWRMAYRQDGKPQTATFGPYPLVTLQQAREKRDEIRARLATGQPGKAPKQDKRERRTLRQACETFWDGRADISEDYRQNAKRALEMHVYPKLGDAYLEDVTRATLLPVLVAMDTAGLHEYVRKVRTWLSQVFDWAIETDQAQINPCKLIDPEKAFMKAEVEHFAALELTEVPDFMRRLDFEGVLMSAIACRLLAIVWTRTRELRFMEWDEIDWEAELWRIPGKKMKRKKDHLIPLPKQAVVLLRHMQVRSKGSPYVFPHERRLDLPMSENTVLYLIHRMGYKGKMTGHGFRSVASTWANEQGFNKDAIERQLAHVPGDKTRAAYNRAEYLAERRVILQAWADWVLPHALPSVAAGRALPESSETSTASFA